MHRNFQRIKKHFWNCNCIIQLMTFNEVTTRIYYIYRGQMVSIELKVINCFIIWHILYVSFTLKISFDHDIFFCLHCWNVIFTSHDVTRGDYNVLSKIVTRDVSQSEKDIIWSHIRVFIDLQIQYWPQPSVNIILQVNKNSYSPPQKTVIVYYYIDIDEIPWFPVK